MIPGGNGARIAGRQGPRLRILAAFSSSRRHVRAPRRTSAAANRTEIKAVLFGAAWRRLPPQTPRGFAISPISAHATVKMSV